ncbi:ATP-binding protein [Oenococcus oeni]
MKLIRFTMKNFRGYTNATIDFSNFTTFVGVNDVGKSTIFEALDIFFGNSKIDKDDRTVGHDDQDVQLIAEFNCLHNKIKLENVDTSLSREYLLNVRKNLEIRQTYSGSGLKLSESIVANFPNVPEVKGIHNLKISDLKQKFGEQISDIDKRVSSEIRSIVLENAFKKTGVLSEIDIPLNGTNSSIKDISKIIHSQLPVYQLFKSDRSNTDGDSEIQEPIKAIVKSTIAGNGEIKDKLDKVSKDVEIAVSQTTDRTLEMLQEMNPNLANQMKADFQTPKWDSLFKFSLDTDSDIPLNKRGSGVRRLILLSFFRAEAKKRIEQAKKDNQNEVNVIYSFEEPETAQHPRYQKMLIDSFKTMSESKDVQVMITTHSPAIAKIVPQSGVRLIKKEDLGGAYVESGDQAIQEVVDQLGIIQDIKLYPDQIKKAVVVEGPDDVMFFENIYHQISEEKDSDSTIFISGGGATIVDVLNQSFIQKLNVKKMGIVDGDPAGETDISRLVDTKTNIIKLEKATLEFYLPYECVKKCLSDSAQIKLTQTKEDWLKGENDCKLGKQQKRVLKSKRVYANISVKDITPDRLLELKKIVAKIDE